MLQTATNARPGVQFSKRKWFYFNVTENFFHLKGPAGTRSSFKKRGSAAFENDPFNLLVTYKIPAVPAITCTDTVTRGCLHKD